MFNTGDVVAVGSGAPMTVGGIDGDDVFCQWFTREDDGEWSDLHEQTFSASELHETFRRAA